MTSKPAPEFENLNVKTANHKNCSVVIYCFVLTVYFKFSLCCQKKLYVFAIREKNFLSRYSFYRVASSALSMMTLIIRRYIISMLNILYIFARDSKKLYHRLYYLYYRDTYICYQYHKQIIYKSNYNYIFFIY